MTVEAWIIFASFWVLFITTPGPNAVKCVSEAMAYGFRTSLICASPATFGVLKWIGAAFLIYLGLRGWITATRPISQDVPIRSEVYVKSFLVATINPKSIAGYLAAFSQFVAPNIPIWDQIWIIIPTSLCLTTLSYTSFCALGAGLGRAALSTILNVWLRRVLATCFIIYGFLLGLSPFPKGV